MVDWTAGYSVLSWRVFRVAPDTWADAEELRGVTSASVERSLDDATFESGTLEVDVPVGGTVPEGYYRVVMVAGQGGRTERASVCTLLCSATEGKADRGVDATSVRGRSVLWPASVAALPAGSYCPRGADGARWCADALRSCLNAPVESRGSLALGEHYVFDPGTVVLDAVRKVLDAIGFVLQVDGYGRVVVQPRPTEPSLALDRAHARLLHPGVRHGLDLSEVPNRYVAVSGGREWVAVNDDPSSVTSTVARGWSSDEVDASPTPTEGEGMEAYAARMLEERSTVRDSRTYSREWWPGVLPGDIVRGTLPSVGLDGDLRVRRQGISCGRGIVVEEQADREVRTWERG